jgi:WD40 repeat protein
MARVTCNWTTVHEWTHPAQPSATSTPRQPDHTYPLQLRGSRRIGFSPQGTYFCGAEWYMHLYDGTTLQERRELRAPTGNASASAFAFSPDETRIVVAFGYFSAIWRLDEPDARPVRCRRHRNLIRAVGFLPGGGTVLSAAMDGTVRLWDSTTGAETRSFDWGIGKIQAAAVSPDGMLCGAGGDSGQIVVWDVDA